MPTRPEAIRRLVLEARSHGPEGRSLEDLYRAFLLADLSRAKLHGCHDASDVASLLWYQFHARKGETDSLGAIQKYAQNWIDRLDRESDQAAEQLRNRLQLITY